MTVTSSIPDFILNGINEKNLTLGALLDSNAELYSNDEAIIIDNLRKSWKQFYEDIMSFCDTLLKLGFHKDEHISLWSQNNYQWMVAWFSLLKLGIVIVPMDHWYKPEEAKYILNHSDSVAVICTSDYIQMIESNMNEFPKLRKIIIMDYLPSGYEGNNYLVSMENLIQEKMNYNSIEIEQIQKTINKHNVAFILYTSGTTGTPKGAQLTHYGIIKNMIFTSQNMRLTHLDKMVIPVPFSHVFGNVVGITLALITGTTMIPLRDQNPKIALETIIKEGATILHGTPTHFIRYIQEKTNHPDWDLTTLRTGIIAGAPCPPETMKGIIEILNMPDIIIGYGETELSPFCCLTSPEDEFYYRVNSVGRKLPEMDIKIVNDNNNPVPIGEKGEICVRGYNVMKGYYKAPDKTKEAIDDEGYIHTGDIGTVDEKGYYSIVGRKKDMIIYGGVNIYPKMIEDYILTNANIFEVAIVGVPDHEYGEVVAAVARAKPEFTEQELIDYCYGNISSPSVPRYVIFSLEIPLSGRGKVQKFKLRETLTQMLQEGKLGSKLIPTKVKERIKSF